jgi:hypothetical protein
MTRWSISTAVACSQGRRDRVQPCGPLDRPGRYECGWPTMRRRRTQVRNAYRNGRLAAGHCGRLGARRRGGDRRRSGGGGWSTASGTRRRHTGGLRQRRAMGQALLPPNRPSIAPAEFRRLQCGSNLQARPFRTRPVGEDVASVQAEVEAGGSEGEGGGVLRSGAPGTPGSLGVAPTSSLRTALPYIIHQSSE